MVDDVVVVASGLDLVTETGLLVTPWSKMQMYRIYYGYCTVIFYFFIYEIFISMILNA